MSELHTIESLDRQPFKYMVATIGNLPTSFVDSMSYYELLAWLCQYLEKTVIPAIDNNAEALEELQAKYIELKAYVDDYFENLDVQEEINNKLDDMAEHGELADIIAQYLQLAGVLAFNTIADMQAATNIANGSTAKTLGATNYLDGKGRYYKIRNITNDDVVDGVNIIQITADPTNTLIAELIPDETISKVATIENTVEHLSDKKYIFIGDSYNTTDTPTGGVPIVPWSLKVRDYMGLTDGVDCFRSGVSGAGWVHNTDHTFLKQLQALSISDKASVTDIVVCGGINDWTEDDGDVYNAIQAFSAYVATNYPNAMIHVGMISWAKQDNAREYLRRVVAYYNSTANQFTNIKSISNACTFFHNYGHYQPDGHPNANGSTEIGLQIANYLKGGSQKETWTNNLTVNGWTEVLITDTGKIADLTNTIDGNNVLTKIKLTKTYLSTAVASLQSDIGYKIGEITGSNQYFWYEDVNEGVIQSGTAYIYNGSNWAQMQYYLTAYQKDIYLTFKGVGTGGNTTVNNPTRIYLYPNNPHVVNDALYC